MNGDDHCLTGTAGTNAPIFWPSDDNQVSSFWLGKGC